MRKEGDQPRDIYGTNIVQNIYRITPASKRIRTISIRRPPATHVAQSRPVASATAVYPDAFRGVLVPLLHSECAL